MEISSILSFFESNIYLLLLLIPFVSQMGLPIGAMLVILYAWAITNNFWDLTPLFLIVLFSTVFWDMLSYFVWRRLFWLGFSERLLAKKKINKIYKKTEKFFNKRWAVSILLSRFLVTWVWPSLNYVVWFQSFDFRKFVLYVVIWEILYAWELLILWFIFKETFGDILNIITNFWLIVLLLFMLYEIWIKLFGFNKKNKF